MENLLEIAKSIFPDINLENIKEPYILTKEDEDLVLKINSERLVAAKIARFIKNGMEVQEATKKAEIFDYTAEIEKLKNDWFLAYNNSKHRELFQIEQRQKENEAEAAKKEMLKTTWSASAIYQLIKYNFYEKYPKKEFLATGPQLQILKTVCFFLSRDQRFCTELGLTFEKGLIIRSAAGVGKTDTFLLAANNGINPVCALNLKQVELEIKSWGKLETKLFQQKIQLLDDVGTETTPIKYFGTPINWFSDFIENYYAMAKNDFNRVVITTNLNDRQILEKYGFRVFDRIKEMFNIVDIEGVSLRK